jgi:DNA-binding NarL/FixJ family response regulator
MPSATSTVLVAAAPTLLRQGLTAILREWRPQLLLTLTADIAQVANLVNQRAYGLVVLDGSLKSTILTALLADLHRTRPTQRLLLLTDEQQASLTSIPLSWPGPCLVLPSHLSLAKLAAGLLPWLDGKMRSAAADTASLSSRELEVLRLIVEDRYNQEIADQLFLSVRTVESHRRALLHKTGSRTLAGLVARAMREGWVS